MALFLLKEIISGSKVYGFKKQMKRHQKKSLNESLAGKKGGDIKIFFSNG